MICARKTGVIVSATVREPESLTKSLSAEQRVERLDPP
jgi:hypothetical protein